MFILHGGQVTGPHDAARVSNEIRSGALPPDALLGPSPQGPWSPAYGPAAQPQQMQIGTLPGLAIIVVGSIAFTAFLLWFRSPSPSPGRSPEPVVTPVAAPAPEPADGRGGIRRAVCPMKAFPCSVSGPDGTVMTIDNGVGCPITAAAFVKDGRESLNQMGFLVVRCPTGQEWRAPTFARVP